MKYILVFFICFTGFSQDQVKHFEFFDVVYDSIGTHKVEYYLTDEMIENDTPRNRRGFRKFNGIRSSDYTGTEYHRGHLASAESFSFRLSAYRDTYSLANVAPMNPRLNLSGWKKTENEERNLALKNGCVNIEIIVEYGDKKLGKLSIPKSFSKFIKNCKGETIKYFKFDNL